MKGLHDYGEKHLVAERIHEKKNRTSGKDVVQEKQWWCEWKEESQSELESLGKGI